MKQDVCMKTHVSAFESDDLLSEICDKRSHLESRVQRRKL